MLIIKASPAGIRAAVAVLKNGGVIVYPTDTAYGLGGLFDEKKVVKKILAIKKRKDKKFVLIAASLKQVKTFFNFTFEQEKLAKQFWPGPLSIVVNNFFSVRVPKSLVARQLAQLAGRPLIASSANISGQKSAYDIKLVKAYFNNQKIQPDLALDAGRLKKIETSTVVKVSKNKVKILRIGAVKMV